MSEPALRQLDRGLPPLNMYNRAFAKRINVQRRKEEAIRSMTLRLPPAPIVLLTKTKTSAEKDARALLAIEAGAICEQTRLLVANDSDRGMPIRAIILDTARKHGVSVDAIKGR